MSEVNWLEIEEIFSEALELPENDRAAFVRKRCVGNPVLLEEVNAMLKADGQPIDLLESSVAAPVSLAGFLADTKVSEPISLAITGETFGGYRVVRKIGGGGMGSVYLAENESGEKVAVKFIKSGLDTQFNLRRFRHEQKILAAFDHPNITRFLDMGVTETGMPFLVMEYVEGQTLFDYCRRRKFDLKEKLKLYRILCRAVAYAHERHILHRDIKPGNVLIAADGTPKLLDFGIAKILKPEAIDASINPTATHFRPFTPDYAAPEQVRGEQMTEASDVYSLGVLLYELLTGERPYQTANNSPYEIIRVICEEVPRSPSAVINSRRTTILNGQNSFSEEESFLMELDRVLLKALRKKAANRYVSVAEFDADLERLLAGRKVHAESFEEQKDFRNSIEDLKQPTANSLAILPFEVLTEGKNGALENDNAGFLGVGLADVLTTRLSAFRQIVVRPTNSVLRLNGQGLDIDELGKALKVEYLLEGHIQRIKNNYRVSVKLLGVADHRVLWSDKFDATESNLFHLQDLIAENVVGSLVTKITGAEREILTRNEVINDAAFEAYLHGRFYWHSYTFEGILKSEEYFKKAIKHDPGFALAYSGLADYYNWLGVSGATLPEESFTLAKKHALRALRLDRNLPEAYASLAFAVWAYEWNTTEAENLYRRALELNANYARAHEWYAYLLSSEDRHDEAITAIERAEKLDPNSPSLSAMAAFLLYNARRYEEAYSKTLRSLELQPDYNLALQGLGWVCPPLGRFEEAIAGCRRAVEISDNWVFNKFSLVSALIADGQLPEARKIIAEIEDLGRRRHVPPYYLAVIYAELNDTETAFRWLDRAIEERGYWTLWMRVEPRLDVLREDPRFAERLEKIKPLPSEKATADFAASPTGGIQTQPVFKTQIVFAASALICVVLVVIALNFKIIVFKNDQSPNEPAAIAAKTNEVKEKGKLGTTDKVAESMYLDGKQQLETRSEEGIKRAVEFFSSAVERDPDFALAFSGLADAHILLAGGRRNHPHDLPHAQKAEEYAIKALALDPDLVEARISLGMAKFRNTNDFAAAEKHFLRAIEIDPSHATAHHWYSVILIENGKYEEALREIEIAARLAPRSAVIQHSLAEAYMKFKRYDEAIAQFDKAIEIEKSFAAAYYWKSLIQQYRGEYDAALETYRNSRIYRGGDENEPLWQLMQAQAQAAKGQREEALRILHRYLQSPSYRKHPDELIQEVALVYNLLGDAEKTLDWLEKIEIKNPHQAKFHIDDQRFANLQNNARYAQLTKRWLAKV